MSDDEASGPGPANDLDATLTAPAPSERRRRLIRRPSFAIGDVDVAAGRKAIGEIPISRLVTGTQISIPVTVAPRSPRRPGGLAQRGGPR